MALISTRRIYKTALIPKEFKLIDGEKELTLPSPPRPRMKAKTVLASLEISEHTIEHKNTEISLTYYSYADKLEIIFTKDSSLNIDIDCNENPIEQFTEEHNSALFDFYVPTMGYTLKTKKTISLINSQSNKTILPMIVVGTDTKLEHYISEDFTYTHFLDLSLLHETTNEDERSKVEEYNKNKLTSELRRKMPQREYQELFFDDILPYYESVSKSKNNVIPVLRISVQSKATLSDAKYILNLLDTFGEIALRVNKHRDSIDNIESFLLPISNRLNKTYIILEENLEKRNNEIDEIAQINYLSKDIKVIFLGENKVNELDENKDKTTENKSMLLFKNLQDYFPELMYGDYCGFEKDTAVSPNGFPAKTARLYYINPDNIDELILRRERFGSNGWVSSMDSLQNYISTAKPVHIKQEHCEACYDLINRTTRCSLGDIKENSIIHNGTCNAMA